MKYEMFYHKYRIAAMFSKLRKVLNICDLFMSSRCLADLFYWQFPGVV